MIIAVYVRCAELLVSPLNTYVSNLVHSEFYENDGKAGGVVTTAYLPLVFRGKNYFHHNRGRVLVVYYKHLHEMNK